MKTLTLGPQIVWSDGQNSLYHPYMAGSASADFAKGRFHLEMRNRTVNAKVRVCGTQGANAGQNELALVALRVDLKDN